MSRSRSYFIVCVYYLTLVSLSMRTTAFRTLQRLRLRVPSKPSRLVALQSFKTHPLQHQTLHYKVSTTLLRAASTTAAKTNKKASKSKQQQRPYRLVIVESPSKCSTIAKILDQYVVDNDLPYDFQVTSCMGHVRNLPKTGGIPSERFPYKVAGIDLDHNYHPEYVILPGREQLVHDLKQQAQAADKVLLATDPDREGEAMAWHLTQVLQVDSFERISFAEITPSSIIQAVETPVQLNDNLIQAQETRRLLDRLAGYTVSPILWKKIAPGLSAGRVQSVGMALAVQRERERLRFESTDYWDLQALFDKNLNATLQSVNGTVVASSGKDFTSQGRQLQPESSHKLHLHQDDAERVVDLFKDDSEWYVVQVKASQRKQQAPLPYRTSTLQQEANRRLNMGVQQTMRTAQQLYENGLISYMRTDSTHLSNDAETAIAQAVSTQYGDDMVVSSSQQQKTKRKSKKKNESKFAQEAHEAIRPAIQPSGGFLSPDRILEKAPALSEQAKSLYRMIYQRSLAYRMPPLITNQTQILIEGVSSDKQTTVRFRASGSVVVSPGYTMAYGRTIDKDDEHQLPPLQEGEHLTLRELLPQGHQTQPPPRYNEASFVKELEALGVGRPSTYAGIVQILRDRAYVGSPVKDNEPPRNIKQVSGPAISARRAAGGEEFAGGGARGPLVPSLSAFVVCSLLEKHCPTYVDPGFTAQMEERLDLIASGDDPGEDQRVAYLNEFYAGENGLAAKIKRIEEEVDAAEARRASLPALEAKDAKDDVGLFVGPWGPYVQKLGGTNATGSEKPPSASLPPGMAADLSIINPQVLTAILTAKEGGGLLLGTHPDDGRNIRLKTGRFGAYLQWGDDDSVNTTTHSLPRQKAVMRNLETYMEDYISEDSRSLSSIIGITLDEAVGYISLPRTVSTLHDKPILASIGPYGPYLKYNNTFLSLNKKDGDVLTIDAETAERLVTDGIINNKSKRSQGVLAEVGEKEGSMVTVKNGRFGPYINWKRINAKLPSEYVDKPSELPLEEAWSLVQEKAESAGSKGGRGSKRGRGKKANEIELPPAPKRPISAYLHFCADKRPEVSETAKSLGEVSKKLSVMWSDTSAKDREEYEAQAAAGKLEYEARKRAWEEECRAVLGKAGGGKNRVGSGARDSSVQTSKASPRRPKSAYLYFCDAMRPKVSAEGKTFGEVSKELALIWSETSDRSEYEALAADDKARYEKEKSCDGKGGSNNVNDDATESLVPVNGRKARASGHSTRKRSGGSKTKSTQSSSASSSTTTRAPSAYILFCREYRPTILDEEGNKLPLGETTKRLAALWKDCDDEIRTKFEQQAAKEKEMILRSA